MPMSGSSITSAPCARATAAEASVLPLSTTITQSAGCVCAASAVSWIGTYDTARQETSGLHFDRDTERLYVWHGNTNDLEVARLSSADVGLVNRKLDTEYVFDYPLGGNVEGVAVLGLNDCGPAGRPLFLVQDTAVERSIQLYPDWSVGCP